MTINFANDTTTIVMNALASEDVQVKNLLYRAQAIEILIDCLKSHPEGVCTRELENILAEKLHTGVYFHTPSAKTLLDWFEQYGWVREEIRTEETIEVEHEAYIGDLHTDRIEYNDDDTITVYWFNHAPVTLYDYKINKSHWGLTYVEGKYKVQVKRKYWFWKA